MKRKEKRRPAYCYFLCACVWVFVRIGLRSHHKEREVQDHQKKESSVSATLLPEKQQK
jgi:hypothetical protein